MRFVPVLVKVPNPIGRPRSKAVEARVQALLSFLKRQELPCRFSNGELAQSTNMSVDQVKRALKTLAERKNIRIRIVRKQLPKGWFNQRYIDVPYRAEA